MGILCGKFFTSSESRHIKAKIENRNASCLHLSYHLERNLFSQNFLARVEVLTQEQFDLIIVRFLARAENWKVCNFIFNHIVYRSWAKHVDC